MSLCSRQWVNLGYYSELSVGDIKDEIFDMVKPKEDLKITLQELLDSKVLMTGGRAAAMAPPLSPFSQYPLQLQC